MVKIPCKHALITQSIDVYRVQKFSFSYLRRWIRSRIWTTFLKKPMVNTMQKKKFGFPIVTRSADRPAQYGKVEIFSRIHYGFLEKSYSVTASYITPCINEINMSLWTSDFNFFVEKYSIARPSQSPCPVNYYTKIVPGIVLYLPFVSTIRCYFKKITYIPYRKEYIIPKWRIVDLAYSSTRRRRGVGAL